MKFLGKVGFWSEDVEVRPRIFRPQIIYKPYKGDVLEDLRRNQNGEEQNTKLTLSNRISIISDLYAQNNWHNIKCVEWKGVKWEVTKVNVSYPRLILSLGGVYNENEKGEE